jgi:hypothetical protein
MGRERVVGKSGKGAIRGSAESASCPDGRDVVRGVGGPTVLA